MDLRALVFLSLIAICSAIGSGDGETLITDDEVDNNDIYLEGSGADNDGGVDTEGEDDVIEGSGSTVALSTTLPAHTQCRGTTCWCVYTDGTEVMGTRGIAISKCTLKIKPVTTELPLRTKATEPPVQPIVVTEATATDTTDEDIIFISGPASIKPVVRLEPSTSTSAPEPSTRYNNKITVGPPKVIIDEDMEEDTNEIGGAWKQVNEDAVQRESVDGPFSFAHPGIMAAVIGGGVVGLLCAILLVMFIIYRMRKKDEGSYPLDDSKPLKNYAYAKAPSKEFYA